MKRTITVLLAVLLTAILFAGCQGGSQSSTSEPTEAEIVNTMITLEPAVDSYQKIDEGTLRLVKAILETRLECEDISGYSVSVDADKTQLQVVLPGQYDTPETRSLLTAEGHITIQSPDGKVLMDNEDIIAAAPSVDLSTVNDGDPAKYVVLLTFSDEGTEKFAEITGEYLNQSISIYMDDELLTEPTIQSPITDGQAQITGEFTAEEATRIANLIDASRLPFPLAVVG